MLSSAPDVLGNDGDHVEPVGVNPVQLGEVVIPASAGWSLKLEASTMSGWELRRGAAASIDEVRPAWDKSQATTGKTASLPPNPYLSPRLSDIKCLQNPIMGSTLCKTHVDYTWLIHGDQDMYFLDLFF